MSAAPDRAAPAASAAPPAPGAEGWRAALAIAVLSFTWGITWVFSKQALALAPPFAFAAQRTLAGAIALLLVLRATGRPMLPAAPGPTVLLGLVQVGGFTLLQTCALVVNGPGKTSVLIFTMPIWTLLLAGLLLQERVRGLQWLAAAGTLAGLTLIIAPWELHGSLLGDALGVGAALCWATGTILVKRLRRRMAVDLLALTAWQMVFACLPLCAIALVVPERPLVWSWHYGALLGFIALASTSLGWWLWVWVLDRVPAWEASLSVLGTPVVAIVSSTLMLGEQFHLLDIAGMALIGLGLGVLSLAGYLGSRQGSTA